MKLPFAKVTYVSDPIDVTKKDGETTKKQILCVEEMNDEKETLERIAIDFMGDKIEKLKGIKEGDVIEVCFNIVYNRRKNDKGEESIFNSVRGWRVAKLEQKKKKPDDADDLPF